MFDQLDVKAPASQYMTITYCVSYFRGILKAAQDLYQRKKEASAFNEPTTSPNKEPLESALESNSSQEKTFPEAKYDHTEREDPDPDFYWIASDGWGKQKGVVQSLEEFAVGAVTVELESKNIAGFDDYIKTLTPEDNDRNMW